MGLPHHAEIYAEQADMDWALEQFYKALKVRAFKGTRGGKRGWQSLPLALGSARAKLDEADAMGVVGMETADREMRVKLLEDAALYIFMEWWQQ